MSMEPTSWRFFLYLSLVGLGLSSYLTAVSLVTVDLSFCEPHPLLSCESVIYSQYSRILGVPVALVGAMGFAALFMLSYGALLFEGGPTKVLSDLAAVISVAGLAFGVYLNYLEFLVIGSLCILCLATFLIIVPMVLLSLRGIRPRSG